jgi:hypothetical protein
LFIGGKSMRPIASHLAAAGEEIAGLVLLGYPLHPPGRPDRLRDAHLAAIRAPVLFLQGSRDSLCDLDLLRSALGRVKAPHRLHVIDDGDHSFKVRKRTGRAEGDVLAEIREAIAGFIQETMQGLNGPESSRRSGTAGSRSHGSRSPAEEPDRGEHGRHHDEERIARSRGKPGAEAPLPRRAGWSPAASSWVASSGA